MKANCYKKYIITFCVSQLKIVTWVHWSRTRAAEHFPSLSGDHIFIDSMKINLCVPLKYVYWTIYIASG